MSAINDIAAERRRQIETEGWTLEHDDRHADSEMALAAACYALASVRPYSWTSDYIHRWWPWSHKWWKPSGGKRRCLIKAAALIVAEIERLDRKAASALRSPEGKT